MHRTPYRNSDTPGGFVRRGPQPSQEPGQNRRTSSSFASAYLSAQELEAAGGQIVGFTNRPPLARASGEGRPTSTEGTGRYVGRSARRPLEPRASLAGATPVPPLDSRSRVGTAPRPRIHVPSLPWSVRLTVVVALVLALGLALRLMTVLVPPIDSPAGVQATHALYVRVLAGQVGGAPGTDSLFLGNQPWVGVAPSNPTAGFPLFSWLAAAGLRFAGAGDWLGRALAALFSAVAGLALFGVVRRAAGSVAAVYSLLFFGIAPLSALLGGQYSPSSLVLACQALSMLMLLNWQVSVQGTVPQGSSPRFMLAVAASVFAALVDAGSLFLLPPAVYLILLCEGADSQGRIEGRRPGATIGSWSRAWEQSSHRGKVVGYTAATVAGAVGWWLYSSKADSLVLGVGDGAGGPGSLVANLLTGGTYVQLVGMTIGKLLTVIGLLLLVAGLFHGARKGARGLFHVWLAAGLLHALFDAGRLAQHEDVLLPLLLPACALVGIGASWAGSLPSRIWTAMTEHPREAEAEFVVSPHTAWLFDLPEVRTDSLKLRPQARPTLSKSLAARSQYSGQKARRASLMAAGHVAVLAALSFVGLSCWQTVLAAAQPSAASVELASAGGEIALLTSHDARLLIVGPNAPELFLASGRTGWAVDESSFSILQVAELQREGASYLVSTDQDWLGRHPDYVGLLANYSVKKLARNYIMFDLVTKPLADDRRYFLESGHTLGGDFRSFWEANGGVAKLGYPISEEVAETNPLDGQQRIVQYFERAVLEQHTEFAGTPDAVMRASVGRWVTANHNFARVAPFKSTADRAYFPQTGHSVKEAFLRYWQGQGGLAAFGYPISEELPEISPADGKVYTVQYFERARMEWHPSDGGTTDEVQLGLIGKQALEMRSSALPPR